MLFRSVIRKWAWCQGSEWASPPRYSQPTQTVDRFYEQSYRVCQGALVLGGDSVGGGLFGMMSLEVVCRGRGSGVGGEWRDCREKWQNGGGASRPVGVLAGPVAIRALEVAS